MPSNASAVRRRRYASANARTAGARSAGTFWSISSGSAFAGDEPASVSSARLTALPSLCQPGLQRLELRPYLGGEPLAELRQVAADLLELLAQAVLVHRQQRLQLLGREV